MYKNREDGLAPACSKWKDRPGSGEIMDNQLNLDWKILEMVYMSMKIKHLWFYLICMLFHGPIMILMTQENTIEYDIRFDLAHWTVDDLGHYPETGWFPTRQGSSIERSFRTWRWEDDLLWARMKVFRTSFYVTASLERNKYVRIGRDVDVTSFLRPRRIMTSGKLSYGPKVGCPLNVRGRLAEWVGTEEV